MPFIGIFSVLNIVLGILSIDTLTYLLFTKVCELDII